MTDRARCPSCGWTGWESEMDWADNADNDPQCPACGTHSSDPAFFESDENMMEDYDEDEDDYE